MAMPRLGWCGLWLLQACTTQPPAPVDVDAVPARVDASAPTRPSRELDASVDAARRPDASRAGSGTADARVEGEPSDGSADASQPGLRPVAAAPCGDDLGFVGGTVRPDIGAPRPFDAAALDLEQVGRFSVFEQDVSVPLEAVTRNAVGYEIAIEAGALVATVYGPSEDAGKSLAAGPFPLVIGAPGFQASYRDYAGFFRHFASHGFVVLGLQTRGDSTVPMHDKEALETSLAITYMLDESPYRVHVDATKIVAAGHSKGGKVSFFAAALDARIDLVFGWDPSNAGGPPCGAIAELAGSDCNFFPVAPNCLAVRTASEDAPGLLQFMQAETFVFGVPADALTNPTPEHNALNFYRGAPSPASLVYLNGGHAAWVESGALSLAANADIIRVTKAVQTAKMLVALHGATGLARYLPGGAYLAAQGSLVRQVATK